MVAHMKALSGDMDIYQSQKGKKTLTKLELSGSAWPQRGVDR
jgi:hypothetical protein